MYPFQTLQNEKKSFINKSIVKKMAYERHVVKWIVRHMPTNNHFI